MAAKKKLSPSKKSSFKKTAKTPKHKKRLTYKGVIGDGILWFVILVGLVILGFYFAGSSLPTKYLSGKDQVLVTILPQKQVGKQDKLQMTYFGGVTGIPTPTKVPTPTPTDEPDSSSGMPMPKGDLPGWKQIFADDFTVNAPTGSWGSDCDSQKVVYTGAAGTKWTAYPKCFKDTYQHRSYRSDQVLSVHDGMLDFFLHPVDGQPAGANPSPLITGTSQYQTYGRYDARFKVDPGMSEYYAAWLLWPQGDGNGSCAESDFPEGHLNGQIGGFAHHCGGQDAISGKGYTFTQWHTYTQEWMPGVRKYYVDGQLIGTSTTKIWDKPERWQLQTETNGNGSHQGHLLVDWVVVYAYQK